MRWYTLAVLLFHSQSAVAATADWELIDEEDGIRVFQKEMPDSPLFAFRGEGLVRAKLGRIVAVFFTQMERGPEWVDMLEETRVLETFGPYSHTIWEHYDNPWPVSDRDFVHKSVTKINDTDKTVTINFRSVKHPDMPEHDCCVRGEIMNTYFRFTAKPNGTTFVECEVYVDPKGMLPNWLVNMVQEDWPANTLRGIRMQVGKDYVRDLEPFVAWH